MALLSGVVWQVCTWACPALPSSGGNVSPASCTAHLLPTSASSCWLVAQRPTSPLSARRGPGVPAETPCRPCARLHPTLWGAGRGDRGSCRHQLTEQVGRPGCRETSSPQEQPGSERQGPGCRRRPALKTQQLRSPKTRGGHRDGQLHSRTRVCTHTRAWCVPQERTPARGTLQYGPPLLLADHSVDGLWHTTVWTVLV